MKSTNSFIDKCASFVFIFFVFLLPILFIPSSPYIFPFAKVTLLAVSVALVLLCLVIRKLSTGGISLPTDTTSISLFVLTIVTFFSALFSSSFRTAFFGSGVEIDAFCVFAVCVLLFFVTRQICSTKKNLFYVFLTLFGSLLFVVLFHMVRVVGGAQVLSFGLFTDVTSNMIGKWNDVAVYAGALVIASVLAIEKLRSIPLVRTLSIIAFIGSLFLVGIVNFSVVWICLGLFALGYLVVFFFSKKNSTSNNPAVITGSGDMSYTQESLSESTQKSVNSFPNFVAFVFLVSLLSVIFSGQIATSLSNSLHISSIDVRPSLSTTYSIGMSTLESKPLLGFGPNHFVDQWLLNKPPVVNQSLFWNSDFNFGYGFLPSLPVTVGLLGALLWIVFLLSFFIKGIRVLRHSLPNEPLSAYFIISSFWMSLFLWVLAFIYIPGIVTFSLSFISLGVFFGSLVSANVIAKKDISLSRAGFISFATNIFVILLLVLGLYLGYQSVQNIRAAYHFKLAAQTTSTNGDPVVVENELIAAATLTQDPSYFRNLATFEISQVTPLLNSVTQNTSTSTLQKQFEGLVGKAIGFATNAITVAPHDYRNWFTLGQIYGSLLPFKIPGSYENAKSNFLEALKRNPISPSIALTIANLEQAHGDKEATLAAIEEALQRKSNYLDAMLLRAQIKLADNDFAGAEKDFEQASTFPGADMRVAYPLGVLYYNDKNYEASAKILEQGIALSPSFSNALYFLGLDYSKLGKANDALLVFKRLQELNPDNAEVKKIIENIQSNNDPLFGLQISKEVPKSIATSTPPVKKKK